MLLMFELCSLRDSISTRSEMSLIFSQLRISSEVTDFKLLISSIFWHFDKSILLI